MQTLTCRVSQLRNHAFDWRKTQSEYIGQRLYPAMKGLAECLPSTPWMMCKSQMLANVIRESRVIVHENELLVGYNFSGGDDQQWLEMVSDVPSPAVKDQLRDYLAQGLLTSEQIEWTLSILKSVDKWAPENVSAEIPEQLATIAAQEGLYWCQATAYNHTVLGYKQVLEKGFSAIAQEIKTRLAESTRTTELNSRSKVVLDSMLGVAEAAALIGKRYAVYVHDLVNTAESPERIHELAELEAVLHQVPAKPARTFYEAVQSIWFAHIINTWEDGINANSIGRLDQILYPYYKHDLENGNLTREKAFELLCCLWIKLYRDYDVQQIALGGKDKKGRDATNELTYLMLDVTEALDFVRCLSVRLHRDSPQLLLRRSLELVAKGKGIPFYFNDDVLIPALMGNGIPMDDACDYAAIGCVEITIPGKANPHAVSSRINLLKCLELAMNNGRSMTTELVLGPTTGGPETLNTLEDVIAAYEQQVAFAVHSMCRETVRKCKEFSITAPMPYKSLLTEGCLERSRDFNDQGALYDYHESMPMGIPNVADSLAAMEKFVFRDKQLTLAELIDALKQNYPQESLRLALLKQAPKYGNDVDDVDRIAVRIFRHYCQLMREVSEIYQIPFWAQPFTFLWLVDSGRLTAATPDGRRQGENLAYSISPMQGRDYRGLSALINSIAKLPQHLAPGCTSAIVEVDPVLFTDGNIEHLVALLKTAIFKGVGQLQFNVVSEETLRKAQMEPEKYRNLAVRVSGFSQKFCLLSRDIQDHIIARTKHQRL